MAGHQRRSMPPPPLKWQPEQFIWLKELFALRDRLLVPSNRWPVGSGGGGAPPPGKSPLTDTDLAAVGGRGSALLRPRRQHCRRQGAVARTIDRSRGVAIRRSRFRQGEDIECPSGSGFGLEIGHDAGENRARRSDRADPGRRKRTAPAQPPTPDRMADIFMPVRSFVRRSAGRRCRSRS